MEEWITGRKIPVGEAMKQLIEFLKVNAAGFFDFVKDGLTFLIEGLTDLLLLVPPLLLIALIALFAYWLQRSWKLSLFIILAFLLITNLGYWEATVQTIALVGSATIVSVIIGVPLGIAAAHRPWLYTAMHPVLDLMQTLPTFVYLIPALILFGLGLAPGLITTVIFAVAAPIRLTHLGLTTVPKQLMEAGEAFGATRRQLLWKVELPAALPSIMAGLTQCIMLSLSMVVIAALIGANGLGKPVVRALNTVNIPMGIEAGLAIVVLAIILDRVCRVEMASIGDKPK